MKHKRLLIKLQEDCAMHQYILEKDAASLSDDERCYLPVLKIEQALIEAIEAGLEKSIPTIKKALRAERRNYKSKQFFKYFTTGGLKELNTQIVRKYNNREAGYTLTAFVSVMVLLGLTVASLFGMPTWLIAVGCAPLLAAGVANAVDFVVTDKRLIKIINEIENRHDEADYAVGKEMSLMANDQKEIVEELLTGVTPANRVEAVRLISKLLKKNAQPQKQVEGEQLEMDTRSSNGQQIAIEEIADGNNLSK